MAIFTSEENMIFNGVDIAATFNKDGGYFVVQNVSGRSMGDIELNTTSIPGRRGSIYRGRDIKQRTISVDFALKAASYEELNKRLEDLNKLLLSSKDNEIQFEDEMDRTYYGTVQNMQEAETDSRIHKGTITIICTDPLKYAEPVTKTFVNGEVTVQNRGAVDAEPVSEFEVLSDITYLDLFTDTDYMRIGRATSEGLTPIDPKTEIMTDGMQNMTGWTVSTETEGSTVKGTMSSNGNAFRPDTFGTGALWHGPAMQKGLPAIVQDFEAQVRFIVKGTKPDQLGKAVVEFLAESGTVVGRMMMYKGKVGSMGNTGVVRVGRETRSADMINTAGNHGWEWKDFEGILRISRRGNTWEGYIAQVDYAKGIQHTRAFGRYVDTGNHHMAPVVAVRVHFGQYSTFAPLTMFMQGIRIWKLNDVTENRVPIIAKAGDIIRFNHETSLITINGEPRNDLKDFGARYFALPKGVTTLLAEPKDKITGTIKYREGYL